MSNRERIARAAAEAQAAALEREKKKAPKPSRTSGEAPKPRVKRTPKPTRMKIVWEICSGSGEVVKTFPYSEKAAAEAELVRLSNAKREHVLRNTKVPMD